MRKRGFAYIRPIFDEEAKYLRQKLNIDIPRESCFMEKNIIKTFSNKDELINLYKITVDKTDVTIKLVRDYENINKVSLTWDKVVKLYSDRLVELEDESSYMVKDYINKYKAHEPIILASGGKDSSVLTHIVRKV